MRKIKSQTAVKILLAVFVIVSLASLTFLVRAYSTPTEERVSNVVFQYEHMGEFDYVAYLKPNEFYDNRLTLSPADGVLYKNLVDNMEITFTYTFVSSQSSGFAVDYTVGMELEAPEQWKKSFPTGLENSVSVTGNIVQFSTGLSVVTEWVDNVKAAIEDETGSSSSTYNVIIKPTIHTVGYTSTAPVDEFFIPELVLSFTSGTSAGNQIVVSGLDNEASGSITENSVILHPEVSNERNTFTIVSLVGLVGLLPTGLYYYRTRPEEPEKKIKEMMSQFEGAIVEVGSEPPVRGLNKVKMNSLQELVYVGEGLGKPVLHYRNPGEKEIHTFYLLDGSTIYEYVFG